MTGADGFGMRSSAATRPPVREERLGWWRRSGFTAGLKAAHTELEQRDMNALIFDATYQGDEFTVIVARNGRASELREAWDKVFAERSAAGASTATEDSA